MHIVKSVGVMSVAKIMGVIYGCIGLLFAPIFILFGLLGSFADKGNIPFAGIFSVAFAIFMPITYGVMGFISGAIGGLIYNFVAKWIGGFELELEPRTGALVAPYPIIPPPTPAI
jgi:hypothetical protein